MRRPRFCVACGGRLAKRRDGLRCSTCRRRTIYGPKPCASALVVRADELLLVRRKQAPFKGWWDVPGGFLDAGEHPEQGVVRELREETGLEVAPTRLLSFGNDAYGVEREPTLTLFYECRVVGGDAAAADDAEEIRWFRWDALPRRVAFASARRLLARLSAERGRAAS
jgi:8-oxo-dGTP diphosphatase